MHFSFPASVLTVKMLYKARIQAKKWSKEKKKEKIA